MTLRNHNVNKNFKFLQSMRLQLHELLAACITINPHIKHLTAKTFLIRLFCPFFLNNSSPSKICSNILTELETTTNAKIKQL